MKCQASVAHESAALVLETVNQIKRAMCWKPKYAENLLWLSEKSTNWTQIHYIVMMLNQTYKDQ